MCPRCGQVHRLSELSLAKQGRPELDWLDDLRTRRDALQREMAELEEKKKQYQAEARRQAERERLPRLLERVAPAFVGQSIDPRDVRVVFQPVEFAVFEGMNSDDGVQGVSLVHLGRANELLESIATTVQRGSVGWRTIRVDDDGNVTVDAARKKA